ncbi:hypothetical protein E2C01_057893 [Portunus trituberculatus]|uniref:Uncharacterized protein n=1 Tax=Portunus trituberculatus TaxID=210409 RepID=A0A5B7GUR0_PORTR|nr:hypothetical protein [Portunus trituberculatus]
MEEPTTREGPTLPSNDFSGTTEGTESVPGCLEPASPGKPENSAPLRETVLLQASAHRDRRANYFPSKIYPGHGVHHCENPWSERIPL